MTGGAVDGSNQLDHVPLFARLNPQQRRDVIALGHLVTAAKGECVQVAGSPTYRLLVVLSGRIRVVHVERTGSERVVRILGPGDYIGETSFVLGRPPEHFAYVDSDAGLFVIEKPDLTRLVNRFPDIVLRMLQTTLERLLAAERLLTAISSSDVSARLAAYLLQLPATTDPDGRLRVQLPVAQQDVASYLGTTPETLSRRMTDLVRAGTITRAGRRDLILLDPERLVQQAEAVE